MLAQQPLPAGDCRRCKHAAMLEIDAANNLWSQLCRAVPATDPAQNDLVDLFACDLEAAPHPACRPRRPPPLEAR